MDQQQMMLDYLLSLGELQPQQDDIAMQRARVEQLRGMGQTPGMRQVGRVAVAANPLEFLSSVGAQGMANRGEQQIGQMNKDYGASRRAALARLRGGMIGGNPATSSYGAMDQNDYGGGV